jgi:16S rRNA (uracil1498-N3)-methyltransferase
MADRFFTTEPLGPGEFVLRGDEAHHLAVVRRFRPGDRVTLFNGDGSEYPAVVLSCDKKAVALNILGVQSPERELPFPVVVAAALPKADRSDFLTEKLTELGVSRFVPLITARSVVRPKPGIVGKLNRAVIEASKQCGRNRLMAVDPPRHWEELITAPDLPECRWVLHTTAARPARPPAAAVVVAVGPEGGFTAAEVTAAEERGWQSVTLGPRVLRTETAAVAAAALLSVRSAIG